MRKIFILSFISIIAVSNSNAQSLSMTTSIISPTAVIKKYYQKNELEQMKKGELVDLYIERINVVVNKIPFIALTNKRGVSISDLGIPSSSNNIKALETQQENIKTFLDGTEKFEKTAAPFADKADLIDSILYLESILKELKMIRD
ncbi:hypothetical protein [Flavobacterium aquiphilum]|uniref:hypothetical protein n=1 Tax=Flavobacterium aquiphilum TaxID=3003261 RepID=UPI00248107D5|nr:hypothetical protein [Flavobacterium aquiphilum]